MKKNTKLTRLYVLVLSVPRGKKEIIADILEKFDVIAYLTTVARGSLDTGYTKRIMFCIIKENYVKDAILAIEDKFATFNSKVSMVYAIPLDSIIGAQSYMMLSRGGK